MINVTLRLPRLGISRRKQSQNPLSIRSQIHVDRQTDIRQLLSEHNRGLPGSEDASLYCVIAMIRCSGVR